MSAKANPTVIGTFILGAIVIAVVGAALFGSGVFHAKAFQAMVNFEKGVSGLQVGSPVTFRGVVIGSVSAVHLVFDTEDKNARIPVFLTIDPEKITITGKGKSLNDIKQAIKLGLRARLQMQSFVTGQLGVELDLLPDVPPRFFGTDDSDAQEIPAAPSEIDELKGKLERLPLDQLVNSLLKTVQDVDAVVAAPEVKEMLVSFAGAANGLQQVTQNDVGPTVQALQQTLGDAQGAIKSIRDLAVHADGQMADSNIKLQQALTALDQAIRQSQKTMGAIDTLVQPNTPSRTNIDLSLRDLAQTMQSLRALMQELERNPNALITGRH